MRVEHRKIADDDRNGQRYGEYTGKCTQAADKHAGKSFRSHVAVANRRHCHKGPPQARGNALEIVARVILRKTKFWKIYTVEGRRCKLFESFFLDLFLRALKLAV